MKTSFVDVAGVDEAKEELREIVDFSRTRRSTSGWVAGYRRECCSSGPRAAEDVIAGRAVAAQANVPFFFSRG